MLPKSIFPSGRDGWTAPDLDPIGWFFFGKSLTGNEGFPLYPVVNQHNYGKSQFLMGKPYINGPFSIAMLVYQRVTMGLFDLSWFIFPFNQSKDAVFWPRSFKWEPAAVWCNLMISLLFTLHQVFQEATKLSFWLVLNPSSLGPVYLDSRSLFCLFQSLQYFPFLLNNVNFPHQTWRLITYSRWFPHILLVIYYVYLCFIFDEFCKFVGPHYVPITVG